ncbi:MAG: glycosyltransferase family protein, partial [Alkalispirochaeta sp.]
MKTVALSCTGEGFGHAARTVALAQMLRNSYRIVIFAPPHLFPFMNENLGNIALEKIPYFSFVKIRDRIDYARTVVSNLPQAIRFPAAVRRIARRLQAHQVDALISDYDPYGSYAADSLGMPILQINHPAVVLRQREFSLESLLAKIVSIVLMGKYHRKMVVSFYNGDVGPVVRKSLEEHRGPVEDFFVVYLKPSYRKIMLRALKRLAIHNVHVFPDPNKNIVDYLARCRGVISSAGHQFMSEALVLGKPVFVVPQTGQYEQLLNARMLELSGRGTWARIDELDTRLQEFVRNTDRYRTGSTPAHP